ncbi:hypothetical protein K502DRAFT_365611 [Neoconidiobolus thromboides FSU 785]|nr:hypothetical protein K502DRAFT_365611 [Neoconidiobolus thromboides FSU 785]
MYFNSSLLCLASLSLLLNAAFHGRLFNNATFEPILRCGSEIDTYKNYAYVGSAVFQSTRKCNTCIKVSSKGHSTIAHVIAEYRINKEFDIQLSESSLKELEYQNEPVPVSYDFVTCPDIRGNVRFDWESQSNEFFARFSVQNSIYGIDNVQLSKNGGDWNDLYRNPNNLWVVQQIAGPYDLKIEASSGETHIVKNVMPVANEVPTDTHFQFKKVQCFP